MEEKKEQKSNRTFLLKQEKLQAYFFNFIKILRAGGSAGIVIKNTFLSNTDNSSVALRKELLESCNLHSVLELPGGTFTGAGVKTVVLFFKKGEATQNIWFYQLNLNRNLGKTNPLNEKDLAEFVKLSTLRGNKIKGKETINSWNVSVKDIDVDTLDLSAKNPNTPKEKPLRDPSEILEEINLLDKESKNVLGVIKGLI